MNCDYIGGIKCSKSSHWEAGKTNRYKRKTTIEYIKLLQSRDRMEDTRLQLTLLIMFKKNPVIVNNIIGVDIKKEKVTVQYPDGIVQKLTENK